MAQIQFTFSGDALTTAKLSELEAQIGQVLPTDYRAFLLNCNGGVPSNPNFRCEALGEEMWVDYFCNIDPNLAMATEHSAPFSMAMALVGWIRIVPKDTLIVGRVCRDNPLILFLTGDRRGVIGVKVLFELCSLPTDEWPREPAAIYPVANSFSKFLSMLHDDESNTTSTK